MEKTLDDGQTQRATQGNVSMTTECQQYCMSKIAEAEDLRRVIMGKRDEMDTYERLRSQRSFRNVMGVLYPRGPPISYDNVRTHDGQSLESLVQRLDDVTTTLNNVFDELLLRRQQQPDQEKQAAATRTTTTTSSATAATADRSQRRRVRVTARRRESQQPPFLRNSAVISVTTTADSTHRSVRRPETRTTTSRVNVQKYTSGGRSVLGSSTNV